MITRALFLSLGWFVISFLAVLIGGARLKTRSFLLSLLWLAVVIFAGGLWAMLTFGVPEEVYGLSGFAFVFGLFWAWKLRDWNPLGQAAWTMTLITTVVFIAYSFSVTAFTPLNPVSFLLAMSFFFVETIALVLGLTHGFESLDVITRVRWNRRMPPFQPDPGYAPMVSLQVPTYNEPPEVVEQTLHSLARLNYPNYEVLVVDNNTPDEANWRALEAICQKLGPRFRLLHLDQWPGFKSGALNFALTQTDPNAEIIAVVDADYRIEPNFLAEIVPAFRDPEVAFVQTPQDYRDNDVNSFAEGIYHGYKYFFEVSMPSRNEHNAIIFCGTMGLLRRSVLEEIGGWDEWCITEDAEASLRILKRGYQSIYIHKTYGRGLMPFSFEGLKKQRFRWGFGGIQILRKHWEALMPWARAVDPQNRLTGLQRYHYLVGGLQWFTDVFNLVFAIFLVLGAIFNMLDTRTTIRPLAGPLIIVPAVFLLLNTWRFVWVLRNRLRLTLKQAVRSMYGFFSLGWVTTLATIQGLYQKEGVFLRTPKSQTESRVVQAVQATLWETVLGLLALGVGIAAFAIRPSMQTAFLGTLLVWQASLFLAAPAYSLMGALGRTGPHVIEPDEGRPVVESSAARWVAAAAVVAFAAVAVTQLVAQPAQLPGYAELQPRSVPPKRLVGIERVPVEERRVLPTLDLSQFQTTPTPALQPTLAPTGGLTPTAPEPTATGLPTLISTPTAAPTVAPTATPLPPTAAPTTAPTSAPTTAPTSIPPTSTSAPLPTATEVPPTPTP